MVDDDFIFPFSTCERPNKRGIAQPYSFFVNLLSIFIIIYFLSQTKKIYSFLLITSILIFEMVHTFSHFVHLPNYLQLNIIHSLSYIINLMYLLTFYNYTHHAPSTYFLIFLICLLFIDIYSFMFLSFIYYFSSSLLIFFSILIYYYKYIPKDKKKYIMTILFLGLSIMFLFYNEKFNCKYMMSLFPNIPFHVFLEIFGMLIFYYICIFFYKL
jgi:hypothetical protein